jgi:polysaccharide chain length determinant protein (PEP-CTERM system associated)
MSPKGGAMPRTSGYTEPNAEVEVERPPADRRPSDPGRIARIWRRRKWLGIGVAALPMTVAVSVILFMPQIYEAKATVLVDRQQVPEHFVQPTVTSALDTRLRTISQEILSRSRLETLIQRFDLYPDLRQRMSSEEVVDHMRAAIKVALQAGDVIDVQALRDPRTATVAFTLSYRNSNPETAALVTNTLASFYVDENTKARERQASGTADFLKAQLRETKDRLDRQEQRVSAFRRQHLGELPEQLEPNLAMLERLNQQLRLNADSQTRSAERRAALTTQLAEAGNFTAPVTGLAGAAAAEDPDTRLRRLRHELVQLRTRYSPKYPDVVAMEAEIVQLEREVEIEHRRQRSMPAPELPPTPYVLRLREALSEVNAEAKTLKSEEARIRATIDAYQRRVDVTPQREHEFKELARDYEATREVYQSLLKRNEEAQIAESMEHHRKGEQFRLLDQAVPPDSPVANRARLIAIAILLSLGLGLAAVVASEHLDTSFHSAEDVGAVAPVAVLVSIPWVMTSMQKHRKRTRLCAAMVLGCVGIVGLIGASYAIAHGNEHAIGTDAADVLPYLSRLMNIFSIGRSRPFATASTIRMFA